MLPTRKQIDALLPFLERFTADGFSVGTWHTNPGYLSSFEISESVTEFQQSLYEHGWIKSNFDWPKWQETAQEYVQHPEKVLSADVVTIQRLFTTHVRKERFCEGHLAEMFENGHIVALLQRLSKIRTAANNACSKRTAIPTNVRRLKSEYLEPLAGTALFYPCCGRDLKVPLELFASVLSDFYFVDLHCRPPLPKLPAGTELKLESQSDAAADICVDRRSNREFRLHRWQRRGEDVLAELPNLGVFFFRGDNPVNGEGSSGVLWLGSDLFSRVLTRLVSGGLVVTDGSNPGPHGPTHLSDFYHDRTIRDGAVATAVPFDYLERKFACIGYVGMKYGPTLVWRVI